MITLTEILTEEEVAKVLRLTNGVRMLDTPVLMLTLSDLITIFDHQILADINEISFADSYELICKRYVEKGKI